MKLNDQTNFESKSNNTLNTTFVYQTPFKQKNKTIQNNTFNEYSLETNPKIQTISWNSENIHAYSFKFAKSSNPRRIEHNLMKSNEIERNWNNLKSNRT